MTALTVADVAARLVVSDETILAWIHRGELRAVNVARRPGIRPTWRITPEALAAFERARSAGPPTPAAATPRRRRREEGVIQFF